MKITDEAVEVVAGHFYTMTSRIAWSQIDPHSSVALNYKRWAREALESLPHLEGATPDQPKLAEILAVIDGERGYMDNWAGRARNDALTDAREAVEKLFQDRPATPAIDREALLALASKWEATRTTPAGFYPEASSHADGVDMGYQGAAEQLLALIGGAS